MGKDSPHSVDNLSRRDFLKIVGLFSGGLLANRLSPFFKVRAGTELEPTTQIEVPPSLMLHARYVHEKLLPGLISELKRQGYSGISYEMLLKAIKGELTLPQKPVMISIDDLSMARGVPSFSTFARMAETLMKNDFPGTFAINTAPREQQDENRWKEVAGWREFGIELATHTADHVNLNDKSLKPAEYKYQIVDSAQEIARRTGQPVMTLVLPFGNGYNNVTGKINQPIVDACKQAGIDVVVGIVGPREPINLQSFKDSGIVLVPRTEPGLSGQETAISAMFEVTHWKRN